MRALFVTTSATQLAPGHPTGLWLEEFAVPYLAAVEAGIAVTVASPQGGAVPLDPKTEPSDKQRDTWAAALQALQHAGVSTGRDLRRGVHPRWPWPDGGPRY
jgi:putative intracellular protease/amidase